MPEFVMKDVLPLLGAVSLQGIGNEVSAVHSAELRDKTTWGDDSRRRLAGLENFEATLNGYWDSPHDLELFNAIAAAAQPFTLAPTNTALAKAVVTKGLHASYSPGAQIGDIYAFGVTMQGDEVAAYGVLAQELAAKTGNGNSAGSQVGAVAAGQRLYANLHVTAASGSTPTLDVIVESDTVGFPSPLTRITFGQKTGAASEHASVAGAITDDYWRVGWTLGGGSPSFTFAVALAIK